MGGTLVCDLLALLRRKCTHISEVPSGRSPRSIPPTVKWMALFSGEKVSNFSRGGELFKSLKSIFH